jgi:hypothetical protein
MASRPTTPRSPSAVIGVDIFRRACGDDDDGACGDNRNMFPLLWAMVKRMPFIGDLVSRCVPPRLLMTATGPHVVCRGV